MNENDNDYHLDLQEDYIFFKSIFKKRLKT